MTTLCRLASQARDPTEAMDLVESLAREAQAAAVTALTIGGAPPPLLARITMDHGARLTLAESLAREATLVLLHLAMIIMVDGIPPRAAERAVRAVEDRLAVASLVREVRAVMITVGGAHHLPAVVENLARALLESLAREAHRAAMIMVHGGALPPVQVVERVARVPRVQRVPRVLKVARVQRVARVPRVVLDIGSG